MARLWQILSFFGCFGSTSMGKIIGGSTGGNVFEATCQKACESLKNHPQTLQNRAPEPPKSSLEPFKTPFLKDLQLKRVKKELFRSFGGPTWPTWLHLGDPRPSQIEAKFYENRYCWSHVFFLNNMFSTNIFRKLFFEKHMF